MSQRMKEKVKLTRRQRLNVVFFSYNIGLCDTPGQEWDTRLKKNVGKCGHIMRAIFSFTFSSFSFTSSS